MKKIKINILLGYTVLVFVATSTSLIGFYIVNQVIKKQVYAPIVVQPEGKPSQYPDYDAIKGDNKSKNIKQLNITQDCPEGGCGNDRPASIEFDGINKSYQAIGSFSRAYLYIEAIVDYSRPLTSWDGIYLTINNWGGHLVEDSNVLPVPPSDVSRLLYNLRSISFYATLEDKLYKSNLYSNINLFTFLQDTNTLNVVVTISSDRPGRVLREVSIYYECFEGSNCDIKEL